MTDNSGEGWAMPPTWTDAAPVDVEVVIDAGDPWDGPDDDVEEPEE